MLIKEQRLSLLPTREISVFHGNPLQYLSLVRTFKHSIKSKTDNDCDGLFFLEQFTSGRPQVLVRSCMHMEPTRGFEKAKELL